MKSAMTSQKQKKATKEPKYVPLTLEVLEEGSPGTAIAKRRFVTTLTNQPARREALCRKVQRAAQNILDTGKIYYYIGADAVAVKINGEWYSIDSAKARNYLKKLAAK